jgi:hypothetical protein
MTYQELGGDWFDSRNDARPRRARRKLAELRNLGCDLEANPDGSFTVSIPAA